jgi:YfiH family protein
MVGSFFPDGRGVLQCELFGGWDWLDHGFSTRHSAGWLEGTRLASLQQIHSGRVLTATGSGVQGEADALVTREQGLHVAVRTADCLPILLADPQKRAVAAIHAGWRGTVAGIAKSAVARLAIEYGSRAEDVHAAIGPGIGVCCFEVGPEVASQFGQHGRVNIHLANEVARQLEDAGIPSRQIVASDACTMCGHDQFWSYRREGEKAGRMWSGVGLRLR